MAMAAAAEVLTAAALKGDAPGVVDQQIGVARRRSGAESIGATISQQPAPVRNY